MSAEVDSFRFLDPIATRVIKAWIRREHHEGVPWTPLPKPLAECKVALLSSAALARPAIGLLLKRRPWLIPRLISGKLPVSQ